MTFKYLLHFLFFSLYFLFINIFINIFSLGRANRKQCTDYITCKFHGGSFHTNRKHCSNISIPSNHYHYYYTYYCYCQYHHSYYYYYQHYHSYYYNAGTNNNCNDDYCRYYHHHHYNYYNYFNNNSCNDHKSNNNARYIYSSSAGKISLKLFHILKHFSEKF